MDGCVYVIMLNQAYLPLLVSPDGERNTGNLDFDGLCAKDERGRFLLIRGTIAGTFALLLSFSSFSLAMRHLRRNRLPRTCGRRSMWRNAEVEICAGKRRRRERIRWHRHHSSKTRLAWGCTSVKVESAYLVVGFSKDPVGRIVEGEMKCGIAKCSHPGIGGMPILTQSTRRWRPDHHQQYHEHGT